MTGSTRLRKLAGAAILGGAGAVTLFLPPAACEARPHDPFSWHEPLSSLFIPFSLRPFELAQYELVGTKLDGAGIQVTEAKDGYECSVALPGVRPADLDVSVEGSVLLLKGKTRHSSFERRLRLPRDAEGTAISATFEDGLLTLAVPRAALIKEIKVTRDEEATWLKQCYLLDLRTRLRRSVT